MSDYANSPISHPWPPIPAAVTRAKVERVMTRLQELSDDQLEGIEATLLEFGDLRAECPSCGQLHRPYLQRCIACLSR